MLISSGSMSNTNNNTNNNVDKLNKLDNTPWYISKNLESVK